jgi:hypothetical protein
VLFASILLESTDLVQKSELNDTENHHYGVGPFTALQVFQNNVALFDKPFLGDVTGSSRLILLVGILP